MTELLIGDRYHSLPLYVYVCVDVGKSGHINGNQIITIIIKTSGSESRPRKVELTRAHSKKRDDYREYLYCIVLYLLLCSNQKKIIIHRCDHKSYLDYYKTDWGLGN